MGGKKGEKIKKQKVLHIFEPLDYCYSNRSLSQDTRRSKNLLSVSQGLENDQ